MGAAPLGHQLIRIWTGALVEDAAAVLQVPDVRVVALVACTRCDAVLSVEVAGPNPATEADARRLILGTFGHANPTRCPGPRRG